MNNYQVNYTKSIGTQGTIIVRAENEQQAIRNAKNCCFTGKDFTNPTITTEIYKKPYKQGFAGSNRQN